MSNVPYTGGAPAVTALLGGHADASFIEVTQVLPLLKAGKVKALAIIGTKRHTQLPEVATFGELGMPGFGLVGFHAVLARAGTPKEVVQRVSDGFQVALAKPDVRLRLQDLGLELVGNTAAQWDSSFADEARQWTRLIERAGVTTE
ncbi:Tripartite tricarboxylate transporter family receptor [compost metagenome]